MESLGNQQRDLDLVRRARLGHGDAKEAIYRIYASYVAHFLRQRFESELWGLMRGTPPSETFDEVGIRQEYLSTDLDDAIVDAVTDTFLRAFDRLEMYDAQQSRFVTWLFAVAKNVLRNKLREIRRHHEQMVLVELEPEHLLHLAPSRDEPERVLISRETRREQRQRVHEILGSLTPRQAEALSLRCEFDLKVREVAQAMGLNEDAAESLIRRARDTVLKKWGSESGLDT